MYDMPTMLPNVGFGNYFLQSSLGKILSQLHARQQKHHQQQRYVTHRLEEYDAMSQQSETALSPSTTVVDSEGTTTEGTEGGHDSPAPAAGSIELHHQRPEGMDTVRRVLDTVITSVTKQLLEANVRKRKLSFSPPRQLDNDRQIDAIIRSPTCTIPTGSPLDVHDQDSDMSNEVAHYPTDWSVTDRCDLQQNELLSSRFEEARLHQARGLENGISVPTSEVDSEEEDEQRRCASRQNHHQTPPLVNGGGNARRVRARSLIDDEQLAVLRRYYAINPRPKKDEIAIIANSIKFPMRVVQVWFQNSRARDRREAKIPALVPLASLNNYTSELSNDQPLDLSKKDIGRTISPVANVPSDTVSWHTPLPCSPKNEFVTSKNFVNNNMELMEDTEEPELVIDEEISDATVETKVVPVPVQVISKVNVIN